MDKHFEKLKEQIEIEKLLGDSGMDHHEFWPIDEVDEI